MTDLIADEILSLPFHSDMSVETLERVVTAIQSFMKNPHVDLADPSRNIRQLSVAAEPR